MSTSVEAGVKIDTIDSKTVERYLLQHPDFFVQHSYLLTELVLPHDSGSAVSLVERQVTVMREEIRQYRARLQELIQIAANNDGLIESIQRFSLALMEAAEPEAIITCLSTCLHDDFQVDAVAIRLFQGWSLSSLDVPYVELMSAEDDRVADYKALVADGKPVCGELDDVMVDALFGDKAESIASVAQLPLMMSAGQDKAEVMGVLYIASHDAQRFHAEQGTVFLEYLAAIIAGKLNPYLL